MKRAFAFVLAMILVLSITGCGEKKEQNNKEETVMNSNTIQVFVVEENSIVRSDTVCQLKQPDVVTASVEEVMTAVISEFGDKLPSYKYMVDEKNSITLDVMLGSKYSKEDNLLIMAAITNTLFQIKDISTIRIIMNTSEGEMVADELYLRDSFYYYDYENDELFNEVPVTIYVADESGDKLVMTTYRTRLHQNISLEEMIVERLASVGTIPENTHVNSISVNGGVCYLNLSSDYVEDTNDGKNYNSEVVVYSIVNSLTSMPGIDSVQFLIDGDIVQTYHKTVGIKNPLGFNKSIVK